jgi:hypothetical protein
MSSLSDWGALVRAETRKNVRHLMLSPGVTQFRIIGAGLDHYVYWDQNASPKLRRYEEGLPEKAYPAGIKLNMRRSYPVIDRIDGQIKVVDLPPSVYRTINNWQAHTHLDIWNHTKSPDVIVNKSGAGLQTKYDVTVTPGPIPLTPGELALIQRNGIPDIYELYFDKASALSPEGKEFAAFIERWQEAGVHK